MDRHGHEADDVIGQSDDIYKRVSGDVSASNYSFYSHPKEGKITCSYLSLAVITNAWEKQGKRCVLVKLWTLTITVSHNVI